MSDTEPATEIDFNELLKLITRELDSALCVSSLSRDWEKKLHITSVRVKLGQLFPLPDDGSVAPEPPKPFLLKDRYQLANQGWMFEVDFASGPAPSKARLPGVPWFPVPIQPQATLMALFSDMPTTVIKGIGSKWASRLKEVGNTTVAELRDIEWDTLEKLIKLSRSNYPIELRFKVRLLDTIIPDIPPSQADANTLYQMVSMPPQLLRQLIGGRRFSATASEELSNILSLLYTTIDGQILKTITLLELRTAGSGAG